MHSSEKRDIIHKTKNNLKVALKWKSERKEKPSCN